SQSLDPTYEDRTESAGGQEDHHMTRGRKRALLAAVGVVLVLAAAGTWVGANATALHARYAAHRLTTAATDEERTRWADALASYGDLGLPKLAEHVRSGDAVLCPAAAAAIERHLAALPDGDPRAVTLCGQVLETFPGGEATPAAVLELLPTLLKRAGGAH